MTGRMLSGGNRNGNGKTARNEEVDGGFLRGAAENDQDVYAMINASGKPAPFQIQQGKAGQWSRVIDTSLSCPDDFRDPGDETPLQDARYFVSPRSVVVLLRR